MRLKDKVALITGGNSGIGLATAKLFIAEGARVIILGRSACTLDLAGKHLGPKALPLRADVTDMNQLQQAVEIAIGRFDKIDIVFATAEMARPTPLDETEPALFEQILRTNVTGVFYTVQAASPFLEPGSSVILNGSIHATLGAPAMSAYAASKGGIRAMAKVLASELSPRGIRVNLLVPGAVRTPAARYMSASSTGSYAECAARASQCIPLGHLGEAEDLANAALFLASDDALHIHATEIVVDGGQTGAPAGAPMHRPFFHALSKTDT